MIVRLTRRQHKRVIEIVTDRMNERWREPALEWFGRDIADASNHRADVVMPAIAWKRVWAVMFDHCFDARGMRTKDVRVTDLNAAKAIRRALNVREVHPALNGTGAIGMIAELVPAWKLEGSPTGFRYSPYPQVGMPFVILAPESRQIRHQRVTQWVETTRVTDRPVLNPAEHFRFA